MKLVRYCGDCGTVGPVKPKSISCCPDGGGAVMVPEAVASQARQGFRMSLLSWELQRLVRDYRDVLEGVVR